MTAKAKKDAYINARVKPEVKDLIEKTREALQAKVKANFPKSLEPVINYTDSAILEALMVAGHEMIMCYLGRQRPEEVEKLVEAYKNNTLKDALFNEISPHEQYAIYKVLSDKFNGPNSRITAKERGYKI